MAFVLIIPGPGSGKYKRTSDHMIKALNRSKKCINDIDGLIFSSRKEMGCHYGVLSQNIHNCSKIKLRYLE